uniref:Uncharacterized protein n=1 Tax=Acrobeloides nanus TaxID=290746 RepID=A0A914DDA4_9BILA
MKQFKKERWASSPNSRPSFSELKKVFEKFLKNPYAVVTSSKIETKYLGHTDTDDNQLFLITKILGEDDYLYHEYPNSDDKRIKNEGYLKVVEDLQYDKIKEQNMGYLKLVDNL